MMNHENIARILDAGTTDTGQPYFVMELVQGIPFNKYCDQNKLSIKDRLELFVPVCKAVQHAHQKGIIHRDLKPSNVLVCLYDGVPVPKVIDFGLAKALQQQTRLTDKTMFTEFGQVVGTLQYMSPEQAEMNQLDIDTRTDIYSLGVMLYELLTGSTPVDQETLKSQAILKILETIREKEPPRPSIRLGSSTHETVTGISAQRQIDPNKLKNILRGELDWIVMKSIEKDRRRRYESATGFADDIVNYLNGEVIDARPPTLGYLVTKFCAKHKKVLAVVSFLAIVLGLSTIFVYFSAVRERALRIASDNALTEMRAQSKRTKHSESIAMAAIDRLSLIDHLEGTYFKAAKKWTSSFNSSAGPGDIDLPELYGLLLQNRRTRGKFDPLIHDDAAQINRLIYEIVRNPGCSVEAGNICFRIGDSVLFQSCPAHLTTLGMCQYRQTNFANARDLLLESLRVSLMPESSMAAREFADKTGDWKTLVAQLKEIGMKPPARPIPSSGAVDPVALGYLAVCFKKTEETMCSIEAHSLFSELMNVDSLRNDNLILENAAEVNLQFEK